MILTLSKNQARNLAQRIPGSAGAELVQAAGKKHKYNAESDKQILTMDGYVFDSTAELKRYGQLKWLRLGGKIHHLEVHPTYELHGPDGRVLGEAELDFRFVENGQIVIEDVKGVDNRLSRWKRKHLLSEYGIEVKLIRDKRARRRRKGK
jgi:hypothetical protein